MTHFARTLSPIDAWDIREGDTLVIERDDRPVEITVAFVEKGQESFIEHAGSWQGGERSVRVTTADGATLSIDPMGSGEVGVDEFGEIQRVNDSLGSLLLSDVEDLRATLINPTPAVYDGEHYHRHDSDEYENSDGLEPRMLAALTRVLDHSQAGIEAVLLNPAAPTASGEAVSRILAEVTRERAALEAIAQRIAVVRNSPRFPKSVADQVDRAIKHTSEAAAGEPSWASDPNPHRKDRWPFGARSLLVQDWGQRSGVDIESGEQVPYSELRTAMGSLRVLRATARIAAGLAAAPLGISSFGKGLGAEIRSIVAELERIAVGRTAVHIFAELPDDPWRSTADELALIWDHMDEHTQTVRYFRNRMTNDLYPTLDGGNLREVLAGMIATNRIDIEDVPVLICADVAYSGRSHAGMWPVSREWLTASTA
jgi:hypothetical protein